jgi:hypothetical protein
VKIAPVAPIAKASEAAAKIANSGRRTSVRAPKRTSCHSGSQKAPARAHHLRPDRVDTSKRQRRLASRLGFAASRPHPLLDQRLEGVAQLVIDVTFERPPSQQIAREVPQTPQQAQHDYDSRARAIAKAMCCHSAVS